MFSHSLHPPPPPRRQRFALGEGVEDRKPFLIQQSGPFAVLGMVYLVDPSRVGKLFILSLRTEADAARALSMLPNSSYPADGSLA